MKKIIIYDNEGFIILQQSGSYRVPKGEIQFLEIDIPENRIVKEIDVSSNEHKVVFTEISKSPIELLQEELAQNTKEIAKKDLAIEQLQKDLADLTKQIANGGM